jgi:outer membrane protein TolC
MPYRRIINVFFAVLLLFSVLPAQSEKKIALSLEECILRAVKSNLGVAVEVINPELAGLSVSAAKEKFLPALGFSYRQRNTNAPSYSWIQASEQLTTTYSEYTAGLDQLIPTGGKLSLSLDSYKNDSNTRFQNINPYYGSTLSIDFTQPLLKDFGFNVSRKEILVAQNNQKISENDFKNILLRTIYDVEEAYWNLVYSIDALEVKRQSLKLAQDLLEKNQKEIDIGTLAPREILSAQAEVALRKADILQTQSLVKDSLSLLRTLINPPRDEGITEVVPVDRPAFEKTELTFEEALGLARQNRPDLLSSKIEVENKNLELFYARNQLLPALNLNASYWSPGLSGTQILYLDNNPFSGIVVGKIPGGSSNAFKDAANFKYKNWSVYLTLDIPLNTVLSRAAAAQAKLSQGQAAKKFTYLEQQAELEIETALRAIQTDYERVEAYRVASDLAQQKLQAEEAKFKAGLSSNYFVLQYQRDLAQARSAELRAIIDYNLSRSRLDRAMGVSLSKRNIKLTDVPSGG